MPNCNNVIDYYCLDLMMNIYNNTIMIGRITIKEDKPK